MAAVTGFVQNLLTVAYGYAIVPKNVGFEMLNVVVLKLFNCA